ncbi:uncharacterized protein LOC128197465 isoform X2 [Vigna angularis]|uniref:uncharacterized protein LOC128197465 isoform X2 n=1 Tax=Phaseolus angularis TaxID=3914 RepID=UPI0022B3F133|nr:uncharacterized protein LOC128197465 isoform X2 [Vigna angularis]
MQHWIIKACILNVGLNEEKHVTNQEYMELQSPLKKLPRTEGGPGHEPGYSGGPGSSGSLILTLLAEDEPNTHLFTIVEDVTHLNSLKGKDRAESYRHLAIYIQTTKIFDWWLPQCS